jgi:transposase
MAKSNTSKPAIGKSGIASQAGCAGIDTGKTRLDVALDIALDIALGSEDGERLQVSNNAGGHGELSAWLRQHRVKRVGIEASGGYEGAVVAQLRRDGFIVIVFQPGQVRAYARFALQRAKNDRLDAALIARCTAAARTIHAPPDPRLAPLAAQLTLLDQVGEDVACAKTRRETCHDPEIEQYWSAEIARLKAARRQILKRLDTAIRDHADLAERLDLIAGIDGIGLASAIAILVRLPEIGRVSREEAAALAGLAPYDDDSGERTGLRHIEGGRQRLRHALYTAAFAAAFHWNEPLKARYKHLRAAGKAHKVALIACARKLLTYANAVVARGTPWQSKPAAAQPAAL